jgi:hypothetical protein
LQRELVRRGAEAAGQPIVDHKNKTRRADNSDLNALLAQAAAGPMRAPLPAAKTRKRKKKSKGPYRRRGIRRRSVDNVNAKG